MRYCFLIPCYNHGQQLGKVLTGLSQYQLPILVIDDGSAPEQAALIKQAVAEQPLAQLHVKAQNSGKGGAVITGFRQAMKSGFSHVLQVDADGQHDLQDIPKLLDASEKAPKAVISGQPQYDDSVPKSRLYGRYVTHFWVWAETLSFDIKDSMCGFRVYPLAACDALLKSTRLGTYMDFDVEILVRLYWRNVKMRFIPTQVCYPEDGLSNFDALKDNVRISWMHTRLWLGSLPRIPIILLNKFR